jgi:enamine deaminase RidA (YjgF/YER057c/UK114 family)
MKAKLLYFVWIPFLLLAVLFSCKEKEALNDDVPTFKKSFIDTHDGYSEAVVVVFDGLKTIRVSGQVGEGPDLDSQMRSALSNLKEVLGKAGASMDEVVKMNTYIVDYGPESLETFRGVRKELLGDSDMPASTLVGVESLALPEWLIEIEAVAVMPVTE